MILSDVDFVQLVERHPHICDFVPVEEVQSFIHAIEAAVLEAKSGQEPVASLYKWQMAATGTLMLTDSPPDDGDAFDGYEEIPVFAAPVVQPDPVLCNFYQVETFPDLVAAMEHHIEKLQAKVLPVGNNWPGKVREG